MITFPRRSASAVPIAIGLTLAFSLAANAQVASLGAPDESPEPEAVGVAAQDLEFADRGEALLAFAQCMRDNDVEMDDPQLGGGGGPDGLRFQLGGGNSDIDPQSEAFAGAMSACSPYLEAARPEIDPEAEQDRLEQQLQLAQCMRDSGFEDYPDPVIGNGGRLQRFGGGNPGESGFDPRSAEFRDSIQACSTELGFELRSLGGAGRGGN